MPNIEVIPNAKEARTPGWAYVADSGIDPSKQAIVPSGARKRARISYVDERAAPILQPGEVSTREQNKINKRLAELDKENHRDVKIEVPGKPKDVSLWGIRPGGKMTLAVKKILGSQKTWANHLDDEEARLAQVQLSARPPTNQPAVKVASNDKGKKSSLSAAAGKGKGKRTSTADVSAASDIEVDAAGTNIDSPPAARVDQSPPANPPVATLELPEDIRNLIRTNKPIMPSPEEIEALLSAPPLSYKQAAAAPSSSTAPPQKFCEMCGYFGRARCMKCGVRVCTLDCLKAHEDTRCQKFYA